MIFPGYGAPNATFLFLTAPVEKHRHEERFAGQQPLAGAHERPEEPALLLRPVAEDGFHLDAVVHVHHAAGFGHRGLVRVELDFDELHVVAENLVVDFVHLCHASGPFGLMGSADILPWTCVRVRLPPASGATCLDLRHVMRYMSMAEAS